MKFKIIANEQTPKVSNYKNPGILIKEDIKMLHKFISFTRKQYNCAGLACNQVSLDGERIMEKFFAIKVGHLWELILDPWIVKYNGKSETKIEGCLTWIGKKIVVSRCPEIEVAYYNLKGEYIQKTITGFEAQVWQHEYNHLMGIEEKIGEKI